MKAVVSMVALALLLVPVAPATGQGSSPEATPQGYWLVGGDGGVFSFGTARYYGSAANLRLGSAIVGMAAPDPGGYWLAGRDGGVLSFGDARFYGSACTPPAPSTTGTAGAAPSGCAGNTPTLLAPAVGVGSTGDGGGYWLVAADGGVFTFGDARFYGSAAGMRLAAPIIGMSPTPDGGGYWLVGQDGGIFSFGDAAYFGRVDVQSPCDVACGAPAEPPPDHEVYVSAAPVGIASAPDGRGYWVALENGQVFNFGDAAALGSAPSGLKGHIVSINAVLVASSDAGSQSPRSAPQGFWLAGKDGGVFTFGDAQFNGSAAGTDLAAPIVGGR